MHKMALIISQFVLYFASAQGFGQPTPTTLPEDLRGGMVSGSVLLGTACGALEG